jgi:uncharacterized protein YecE (DUF72 family)
MKGQCRVGTSGWIYRHWKGVYYPEKLPQKDWFGHYAADFDTVEINNTFYRLPEEKTFEHWRQVAPPGFVFTLKASRYITHLKRLLDPAASLEKFLERARLCQQTLGPILYQLPPRWPVDVGRLELFLRELPADLLQVLEFRDDSWYNQQVRQLLERYGIAFCIHDHGSAPSPEWITGRAVYLRRHGSAAAPYSGGYAQQELEGMAKQIGEWRQRGLEVYVYFNNDIGGHAVRNALSLKALLAGEA